MDKQQQEQQKELAEITIIKALMRAGIMLNVKDAKTIVDYLISEGWRKAGELTVSERKTTSDGQELLLYRLTRKEVLSIPLKVRQGIIERQVNNYFANLSDDEKLEELKRYSD